MDKKQFSGFCLIFRNEKVCRLSVIEFCCNQGHQDFVNCLAVSPSGNFVVSGSHDRSVRLWEKSDEILILSEEREMVGCSVY